MGLLFLVLFGGWYINAHRGSGIYKILTFGYIAGIYLSPHFLIFCPFERHLFEESLIGVIWIYKWLVFKYYFGKPSRTRGFTAQSFFLETTIERSAYRGSEFTNHWFLTLSEAFGFTKFWLLIHGCDQLILWKSTIWKNDPSGLYRSINKRAL